MFFSLSSSLCDFSIPFKQFASSLFHGVVIYNLKQLSLLCESNLATVLFACERLKVEQ